MDLARLREALRKQGIYVHESDPVLEVAAICQLAVADTMKAIEGLNKAAADRITASSGQHIEAAKQSASFSSRRPANGPPNSSGTRRPTSPRRF